MSLELSILCQSPVVEGRYLKLGEYSFALSRRTREPDERNKVIAISMAEIENLNENYEVSSSILDFLLQ